MSSKLIKLPGNLIDIPGDEVIVDVKVWKSGKVQLQAPTVMPADLIKMFNGIITDVTFAALTRQAEANNEQEKSAGG